MTLTPLDVEHLRARPLELLVVFADAVKAYADDPGDHDLRCRVLLLGGFITGMAVRRGEHPPAPLGVDRVWQCPRCGGAVQVRCPAGCGEWSAANFA